MSWTVLLVSLLAFASAVSLGGSPCWLLKRLPDLVSADDNFAVAVCDANVIEPGEMDCGRTRAGFVCIPEEPPGGRLAGRQGWFRFRLAEIQFQHRLILQVPLSKSSERWHQPDDRSYDLNGFLARHGLILAQQHGPRKTSPALSDILNRMVEGRTKK